MAAQHELVIDRHRIFGSIGENLCKLGCTYCFVDIKGYVRAGRIDQVPLGILQTIVRGKGITAIFPGIDVDVHAVPGWADEFRRLAKLGVHLLYASKLALDRGAEPKGEARIAALQEIDATLRAQGAMLHPSMSITRLDEAESRKIELRTSTPQQRIDTVRRMHAAGLAASVSIRPTLPFVPEHEFDGIFEQTARFCDYYLASPFYLTDTIKEYLLETHGPESLAAVEPYSPSYMAGKPTFETIQPHAAIATLGRLAAAHSAELCTSTDEGIALSMALHM